MFGSGCKAVVNYIEFKSPDFPSPELISADTYIPLSEVLEIMGTSEYTEALVRRGLVVPDGAPSAVGLLPEQLAAVAVLLDTTDRRTKAAKLKSLGITTQQYSAWRTQKKFSEYAAARAELLFGSALPDAHATLVSSLERGDVNSAKFYYEMTGRYTPARPSEVNLEIVLLQVLEIITRNITDPVLLTRIGNELTNIIPGQVVPQSSRPALPSSDDFPLAI